MNLKTKTTALGNVQLKTLTDSGQFEGYGAVFGNKDSHSDIIVPGAFKNSLAALAAKGKLPKMLWQHKWDEPIGFYQEMYEDDYGLFVKGQLLIDDDPLAKRCHAHMKAGSLDGLSIGYYLKDYEYDKDKQAWMLKEIDLFEVSPVTFASNEDAQVLDVKSADGGNTVPDEKALIKHLCDLGLKYTQAVDLLANGYQSIAPQMPGQSKAEKALSILQAIPFE